MCATQVPFTINEDVKYNRVNFMNDILARERGLLCYITDLISKFAQIYGLAYMFSIDLEYCS